MSHPPDRNCICAACETLLESKARAWDEIRALVAEFDGSVLIEQTVAIIGEYIGRWEHAHPEAKPPDGIWLAKAAEPPEEAES